MLNRKLVSLESKLEGIWRGRVVVWMPHTDWTLLRGVIYMIL